MTAMNTNVFSERETNQKSPRFTGIKIAIFSAFVLAIGSLGAGGFLYQSLNTERRARIALEAANLQLDDQVQALKAENEKYEDETARMREQLKAHAAEREDWKKQLDEAKAEAEEARAQNKSLEEKVKTLEESVTVAASEIPAAGGLVPPGAPAGGNAIAAPSQAPSGDAPGTVEAKTETPAAKGFQVMTVNRKFNFVVINLGLQQELKMGDKLGVERNGKNIATIQIEKLYDHFAAAAILEEIKDSPIKEGDLVRKI